jgi:hypothetical protein
VGWFLFIRDSAKTGVFVAVTGGFKKPSPSWGGVDSIINRGHRAPFTKNFSHGTHKFFTDQ